MIVLVFRSLIRCSEELALFLIILPHTHSFLKPQQVSSHLHSLSLRKLIRAVALPSSPSVLASAIHCQSTSLLLSPHPFMENLRNYMILWVPQHATVFLTHSWIRLLGFYYCSSFWNTHRSRWTHSSYFSRHGSLKGADFLIGNRVFRFHSHIDKPCIAFRTRLFSL